MKKQISLLLIVIVGLAGLVGCSEELKNSRTVITETTDSTITINYEGKTLELNCRDASLTSGAVMQGDSAIVDFIGKGKNARAVRITLIPRQGTVVSLDELKSDTTSNLITKPITK